MKVASRNGSRSFEKSLSALDLGSELLVSNVPHTHVTCLLIQWAALIQIHQRLDSVGLQLLRGTVFVDDSCVSTLAITSRCSDSAGLATVSLISPGGTSYSASLTCGGKVVVMNTQVSRGDSQVVTTDRAM